MDNFLIGLLNDVYGGDLMVAAYQAVTIDPQIFDSLIDGLSTALKPIASVLVTIYFMMAVLDKLTNDSFNVEQFIKLLLKLVLAIVIVDNASEWSKIIMQFGVDFGNLMTTGSVNFMEYNIADSVDNMDFWTKLLTIVTLIIPWLIALLLRVAVYFIGYGRIIEVGIRSAFAPIGMADIVTGGPNSNGFRYLKKMIAISMQGGIMIIVMTSGAIVCKSVLPTSANLLEFAFIVKYFGVMASMVGIMASAKSLANEIVGV